MDWWVEPLIATLVLFFVFLLIFLACFCKRRNKESIWDMQHNLPSSSDNYTIYPSHPITPQDQIAISLNRHVSSTTELDDRTTEVAPAYDSSDLKQEDEPPPSYESVVMGEHGFKNTVEQIISASP